MTREEAINKWVMPAIKNTWNEKKCGEIIEALEQEPCESAIDYLETCYVGARAMDDVEECVRIARAIEAYNTEPCEDAISRKELDKALYERFHEEDSPNNITDVHLGAVRNFIKNFPSVNPQPRTGHWIMIDKELQRYKCSECGEVIRLYKKSEIPKLEKDETLSDYPFSHCGCRMVEPQESEGEE